MNEPIAGPLAGLTVLEMRGIGPGPLAGMLLADMGAEVILIDRPFPESELGPRPERDVVQRNKRSIVVDLKSGKGLETLLQLVRDADVLIEGYRPGVAERLGFGPDVCLAANPRLVYGRMTGYGQTGPYSSVAGHDINYIALAGLLEGIGHAGEPPTVPGNYIGDYGGGTMFLLFGILSALYEATRSGQGQVVDASMVEGAALFTAPQHALLADGKWGLGRGGNITDGSTPHYTVYECADGKYLSIGPIEPQFYAELRTLLDLRGPVWEEQYDKKRWDRRREILRSLFLTRTRDEWCELLERTDACFAPVLDLAEAPSHPHNVARGTFTEEFGVMQPAPAPQLSRTPGSIRSSPPLQGQHTLDILRERGFDEQSIAELLDDGAIRSCVRSR